MSFYAGNKPRLFVVTTNAAGEYAATAQAVNFVRHPKYNIRLDVSSWDVSVIDFKTNSAPATSTLVTRSPAVGQPLTIIGYGTGTNRVGSLSGGFINFNGLPEADDATVQGNLVASGSGDSGGPLFVNGKLAGITSGGGLASDGRGAYIAVSKYVDINNKDVKPFLASQLKVK